MNIETKLQNEIKDVLMVHPISFIVMNETTHKLLIDEISDTWFHSIDKLTKYMSCDILISEDVNDNEFKIG